MKLSQMFVTRTYLFFDFISCLLIVVCLFLLFLLFVFAVGNLCNKNTGGGRIKRNALYYVDKTNKFHWCKLDYEHLPEQIVVGGGTVLVKSDLLKKKNSGMSFLYLHSFKKKKTRRRRRLIIFGLT